eukprot:1658287-Amphidinium_carterae.1
MKLWQQQEASFHLVSLGILRATPIASLILLRHGAKKVRFPATGQHQLAERPQTLVCSSCTVRRTMTGDTSS